MEEELSFLPWLAANIKESWDKDPSGCDNIPSLITIHISVQESVRKE
jgi:hypothetical protein